MSDRPLNIAIVHASDRGGGAEASTLSMHRMFRELGHRSRMFVAEKFTDDPDVHALQRIRVFPGLLRGARWCEQTFGWQYLYHPWFRRLDRLLGPDVDVVHYQSLWYGKDGFTDVGGLPRLCRLYPSIMTLRDLWMLTGHCACPAVGCERWRTGCGQCPDLKLAPEVPVDGTAFNWRRKQRAISTSNLRVTTVSHWLKQQVEASPIFAGKQTEVIYNGVDPEIFHVRSQIEMRQKLGLPTDTFIVLITGQAAEIGSGHGRLAAESALAALQQSGVDPFVLVISKTSDAVRSQWPGAGAAVAFQTDPVKLAEYYAAADLTLVASVWETFGRVAAESQMTGTPVVGFATGGTAEVVEHGASGLLVPFGDVAGLADAIRTLFHDPDKRRRFAEHGADRARRLFEHRHIALQYIDQYRQVIAARRPTMKSGA